ncbi:MAG: NAD(P)H-dependent oxidoreductase [Oscillospiraceae bacterium]|nr:NAD(P)H-dependent oxidoreductase [Oscillospiraceae bacterium]
MKVIAICGSTRENGNTSVLLRTALEELRKADNETELIVLAGEAIAARNK